MRVETFPVLPESFPLTLVTLATLATLALLVALFLAVGFGRVVLAARRYRTTHIKSVQKIPRMPVKRKGRVLEMPYSVGP